MSTQVYSDGDTVYVERDGGSYTKVTRDGDPTVVFKLPASVIELIDADSVESDVYDEAYNEGYDAGYGDGEDQGYTAYELEEEYERGYNDGREAAAEEKDPED